MDEPPRPLIEAALVRPARGELGEDEGHQQLPAEHDEEAPPCCRTGARHREGEDPVERDDRRDEGERQREDRPQRELALEPLVLAADGRRVGVAERDRSLGFRHGSLPLSRLTGTAASGAGGNILRSRPASGKTTIVRRRCTGLILRPSILDRPRAARYLRSRPLESECEGKFAWACSTITARTAVASIARASAG